jgi:predicted dienelactone hydrolase
MNRTPAVYCLLNIVLACAGLSSQGAAAEAYVPKADETHVGYRKASITYKGSDQSERSRSILLWYPTSTAAKEYNYLGQIGYVAEGASVAAGKHPVILFSHGFLGMPDQSIFLTEGLARHGYIVAAIAHADGLLQKREKPIPAPRFGDAKSWNEEKFRDRREDIVALLNHLIDESSKKDSAWHGHVDQAAIGAAGHSLGGYTTLGLIGGWQQPSEKRIKAALALSPYTLPYHTQGHLQSVSVPVMFQGGTFDWGITPLIPPAYQKLVGPKYYLVLKNENHFGWTNLASLGKSTIDVSSGDNPKLMLDYSIAFFDRYLRGEKESTLLEEKSDKLSSYEFSVK